MVQKKEAEDMKPDVKPDVPKKTYRSPELVEYGNLSKLTQGPAGSFLDGASGMSMTPMA